MKFKSLILRTTQLSLLITLMTACAGGIDPTEDPLNPGDGENANFEEGNGENFEGNNLEGNNFEGNNLEGNNFNNNGNNFNNNFNNNGNNFNNNGNGNNFNNEENLGNNMGNNELVNNAEGEDFLNNPNSLGNNENAAIEENSAQDFGISNDNDILVNGNQNGGNGLNEPAPNVEQAAIDTSTDLESANAAPAPSEAPAQPSGGGRVKYVKAGGTDQYDQPNGTTVRSLEQGDHPLVSDEGEWSRTSDGMYVPSSALSTRPVPRMKSSKAWR